MREATIRTIDPTPIGTISTAWHTFTEADVRCQTGVWTDSEGETRVQVTNLFSTCPGDPTQTSNWLGTVTERWPVGGEYSITATVASEYPDARIGTRPDGEVPVGTRSEGVEVILSHWFGE